MKKCIKLLVLVLCLNIYLNTLCAEPIKKTKKSKKNTENIKIDTIDIIEISGNDRVDEVIIKNYLPIKEGDIYTDDIINNAVKKLYSVGLFQDVNINYIDGKITINVVENPLITEILFDGNDKLDDEILLAEISLTKRSVFNKNKLNSDVKRILDIYRRTGRFSATINPQLIREDKNRIKLVFQINEGKPAKIRDIHIVGSNAFSEEELKSELRSKESKILNFSSDEVYDPLRLEYDKELLRQFYLSKGYPNFEVLSAVGELDKDDQWFDITILIEEGEKYHFGNINITNNIQKADTKKLEKVIKIKQGKTFNATLMNNVVELLINELSKQGFMFVDVKPATQIDDKNRLVDVNFIINETPKFYIGKVDIIGNTRTYDYIIRRELRIDEGDPFNMAKFNRSIQRIRNLGYFENVEVQQIQGKEPNQIDLIIEVQERKTGELQFGVGYSSIDGTNINMGIKENNLLGRGQTLGLNVLYSEYSKDINVNYGKPYFLDRNLYAGFNLFYTKDEDEYSVDYKETSYGGGVNANYSITEYLDQRLFYSLNRQKITDVSNEYDGIITIGDKTISAIGQTLYYDRLDSRYNPTKGFNFSWTIQYAGIGGDKDYLKNTFSASLYIPVFPNYLTLKLSGKGGIIEGINGESVDPVDGFYLGGMSLKGFKYGGIGPRTINYYTGTAEDGSSVGGKRYYVMNAELKFPLGLPKEYGIYGSIFINAGTVTGIDYTNSFTRYRVEDSGSLRSAYGLSILWQSPMGPLSFDFAKVIKKEDYDEYQNFAFNFGSSF